MSVTPEPALAAVPQPRPWVTGVVLVLLGAALFFSNLGAHDLWGPDEVRYALVAREMRTSGEYIVPHLNGGIYQEKPPMVFWLTSLFAELYARVQPGLSGGHAEIDPAQYVNEVTARLPSAFAALCTMLLIWRAAARRWDEWTGLVAAVILATSVQFFWFSRNGALDMVLTCYVTLAILAGVHALDGKRLSAPWGVLVGLAIAGGTLTKGPVALLIPLLVLGAYGWSIGRGRRTAWLLAVAAVAAVLVVAPWWQAAYERSSGVFGNMNELARQTSGRMVNSYSHQKPFYHYALGILGEFMPWSVFLPGAIWSAFRARGTVEWPRLRLACLWILVPFLVFSAISGKRGQYLLPIYPGLALLTAAYLRQYAADLRPLTRVRELLAPALVLAAAMGVLGLCLMAVFSAMPLLVPSASSVQAGSVAAWRVDLATHQYLIETLRMPALGGGMALACLGMWSVLHHLHRPPSRVFATIAVCTTLIYAFVAGTTLPAMDQVKSARAFATVIRGLSGLNAEVVMYHSFRPDIAYYYGRQLRVETPQAIATAIPSSGQPVLAIMRQKHYDQLRAEIPPEFVVVYREQIGSRVWLLLANRAPTT